MSMVKAEENTLERCMERHTEKQTQRVESQTYVLVYLSSFTWYLLPTAQLLH